MPRSDFETFIMIHELAKSVSNLKLRIPVDICLKLLKNVAKTLFDKEITEFFDFVFSEFARNRKKITC
jgi:hypothetical protein